MVRTAVVIVPALGPPCFNVQTATLWTIRKLGRRRCKYLRACNAKCKHETGAHPVDGASRHIIVLGCRSTVEMVEKTNHCLPSAYAYPSLQQSLRASAQPRRKNDVYRACKLVALHVLIRASLMAFPFLLFLSFKNIIRLDKFTIMEI